MKIILASESASRRRALDILGLDYDVRPSGIDEKAIREPNPENLVSKLSEAKARRVAEIVSDAIVVAGDAVVAKAERIYEKPVDPAEAFRFLKEFSGQTVDFVTAVSVLNTANGKMLTAIQRSELKFRTLVDFEIDNYIRRYDVRRFAGAFDGDGLIRFADQVSGSYNFATGVALNDLIVLLRRHGVTV